jgi:predicted permease
MPLLRLLLHLFPANLREDRGAELLDLVAFELGHTRGPARWWRLTTTAVDIVVSAVGAHLDLTRADLADVARTCRRSPGFAAAVVAVSALGVAAATAAFTVADHVLVRPLPFAEPDRLVKLWQDQSARGYSRMEVSPGNFDDWQRQATSFSSMAAFTTTSVNALIGDSPTRLDGATVTPALFETLGVGARLGRALMAVDASPSSTPPVVLSDNLWRSAFGGRQVVLGSTITLDGMAHVVVGVMPPGFEFPKRDVDVWLPLRFSPEAFADRGNTYLQVVARLAHGVSLSQTRAEMTGIAAGLERAHPEANDKTGVTVIGLRQEVSSRARTTLVALVGAAAAVLLMACANLASLLLARSVARQRDLAVRVAFGARPRRLARQVLTESVALSLAGGALGTLLAVVAVPVAAALVPTALPIAEVPSLDLRMLGLALVLTIGTGIAFGLVPAWRVARGLGRGDMRHGSRVFSERHTERLRSGFVVAEIAASVVLLVVVGLFLEALWQVQRVPPGFDATGVLTARTVLPMPKYEMTARRGQFYQRVLDEVRALPGVEHAGYTSFLPMVMRGGIWPVMVDGTTAPEDARAASVRFVTPGYLEAMRIPVLRGRAIEVSDVQTTLPVVVVSQSFAAQHWPGLNPIGRSFSALDPEFTRTVVGVVGDVRVRGLEQESEPQMYFAAAQAPDRAFVFYTPKDLVVRTSGTPGSLVSAVGAIVRRADPEQPISDVQLMSNIVERETTARSTQIAMLTAFAGLALMLALVGLHSLLTYVVASRTQEIGVRMALGATRSRILGLVLARSARLATVGVVLGLGGAYAASRSFQALLFGVSAADAGAYAAAGSIVVIVALVASIAPARKAMLVDPVDAIRAE